MTAHETAVDAFVRRATTWQAEIQTLRSILLGCGLDEAIKWGKPCFTAAGRNVAIIQPFKQHCALMFFQGRLLDDPAGLLRSPGEHSRSALRLEFTNEDQIKKTVVRSFVRQALALADAGQMVDREATPKLELPDELTDVLRKDPTLAKAFAALTPGRQRGYVIHVTGAKQAKTRLARIDKCRPRILAGKGLHDR